MNVVVHVANTGTRTAEHFETGLYVRPQREGSSVGPPARSDRDPVSLRRRTGAISSLRSQSRRWSGSPGTYEIRAVVDVGNAIQETDEFNNELVVVVTLIESAAGLPDLQPIEIDFTPTDPSDETAPWTVAVTVTNTGDEIAGPFRVTLLRNGLAFATIPQFGLPKAGRGRRHRHVVR